MRRRLVILALDGLARLLAWLPLPLALNLGKGLGFLTYLLYGSFTVNRIESFLPGQGRRIGRAHLVHLGMLIFESLRAPYRPQDLARIEVRGWEHLPTAGGVLLSGHFGNIELLGSVLGRSGHKVADLAWRAEDPLTQFVDQHRRAYGIKFIYTSGSVHARARAFLQAERLIADGYMVAFMIDSGASGGLEMEFLGRPRKFDLGGELLARRTQRPLAACFITRTAQGHLAEIHSLPSGEPTRTVVQLLEERTRARPEQYLWFPPMRLA